MADKEADEEDDVGSAKAKADASAREYRRKNYEDSWEGIDPEKRKKSEAETRKKLGKTGKDFPNFDDVKASEVYPDPKVSPLIYVSPLHDHPRSPKDRK